jgi:hypothetical protein
MKDRDFLIWIHERLTQIYGENPQADFMHKLRAIILATPPEQETMNVAVTNNITDLLRLI